MRGWLVTPRSPARSVWRNSRRRGEETYGVRLTARIGINSGEMTVGLVGSNRLHNYSVIGDGVNFASRLEGANKAFGTSILIAQRTVDLAGDKIEVRPLAKLQVKGKTEPVMVYELLARSGELDAKRKAWQEKFTAAFAAFQAGEWDKACGLLEQNAANEPARRAGGEVSQARDGI